MRQLETSVLGGYGDAIIDRPPVFELQTRDGRLVSYEAVVAQTPAVTSSYDGRHSPQFALRAKSDLPIWSESADFEVGRLTAAHGRNLEVLAGSVVVRDSFGNTFNSLCIKGSDFSDPHIFESATASRGHIIHGLQESLVMERVLRASQVMRENNIGAEYICGLVLPEQFPLVDNDYGIDAVRNISYVDFVEHIATKYAQEAPVNNAKSPIDLKNEMIQKFHDCDYLITYRAMDIPYRLDEVLDETTFQHIKDFIIENKIKVPTDESVADMWPEAYLLRVVVPNLADNLATTHDIGLLHGFPHQGNLTALGSLVDLDSCRGEPLDVGDERITRQEIAREVLYACTSLVNVTPERSHDVDHEHSLDLNALSIAFVRTYMNKRFTTKPAKEAFLVDLLAAKAQGMTDDRIDMNLKSGGLERVIKIVHDVYLLDVHEAVDDEGQTEPLRMEGFFEHFKAQTAHLVRGLLPRHLWTRVYDVVSDSSDEDALKALLASANAEAQQVVSAAMYGTLLSLQAHFLDCVIKSDAPAVDILSTAVWMNEPLKKTDQKFETGVGSVNEILIDIVTLVQMKVDEILLESLDGAIAPDLRSLVEYKKDFLGVIARAEGALPIPVLYTSFDEENETLNRLGITLASEVTIASYQEIEALLAEPEASHTVIALADIDVLSRVRHPYQTASALWNFANVYTSSMPKLFVQQVADGPPRIFALPTFRRDGSAGPEPSEAYRFEQLLSHYAQADDSKPDELGI